MEKHINVKQTLRAVGCALGMVLLLGAYAFAASWPLFRGCPERQGTAREYASPSLSPRWQYTVQGEIVSSPVVYKGIVYCGARDNSVRAWDAVTGEDIWQSMVFGWVDATPCVSSSAVYVLSFDRNLYAFDRLTGDTVWPAPTPTGAENASSPVLYDGKLYFLGGYPESKLFCVDAANGAILNAYPVSKFGFSSPAVKDHYLYFGTNDGQVHCFDLDSGHILWSRQTGGGILYSTLAAGEDALYAVSGGNERALFCLDPLTGAVLWRSTDLDTMPAVVSSVSVGKDRVFVASTADDATALKIFAFPLSGTTPVAPLTGWPVTIGRNAGKGIVSSPAVADDRVYIGSGDGCLYCLDAQTGKYVEPATGRLSDAATGYYLCTSTFAPAGIVSSPALSNGRVYIGTLEGNFWAFEAAEKISIASPDNDDVIINAVPVSGSATGAGIEGYRLDFAAGTSPLDWKDIGTSTVTVAYGILGTWDTRHLSDGAYSLRMRASNAPDREAVNDVLIDNSPQPPAHCGVSDTLFDAGGSLDITWDRSPDDGGGDNDVEGYRIYKSSCAGGFIEIARTGAGITAYADAACPVQTTWYYAITAVDHRSESVFSPTAAGYSVLDGQEITPESGGTISLEVGGRTTELVIEPHTFASTVRVGIAIPESFPQDGVPRSAAPTNIVREFGVTPHDVRFLKPVTVKIPLSDSELGGGRRENARIYWRDDDRDEWRIINTSDPLAEEGKIVAVIPHFSLYRVMMYAPGREELLAADGVYTYPNPAKDTLVNFKYYLGDKADVSVDIYTVAGQRVAHLEKENNPAGIVSSIAWDISNRASGVYVYRIEARSGSAARSVRKKFAIIH